MREREREREESEREREREREREAVLLPYKEEAAGCNLPENDERS
jgi:hypothetical protein